ncbi:MAG: hypothetical protein QM753_04760 [Thermomicrobiales bacterium]
MHTYRLVVGPDGTLQVPDAVPGQEVTVVVEPVPPATPDREPLTLATAKTPEERAEVIASIEEDLERLQRLMRNGPIFSTDDLYGQDGLPV